MRGMGEHPAYEAHGYRDNGEVFGIAVLGRLPETEALARAQQYADRWHASAGLFSSQWRRGSWRMRLRSRAARQRAFRMLEPPAARIRL